MSNVQPDAVLIQRARRGDQEAFGELVLRYRRPVLAVAYRMTGDAALAEDAAQAAFLQAWAQLASLRESAAFKGWLYRLAVNASIDHRRRSRATEPLGEDAAAGAPSPAGPGPRPDPGRPGGRALLAIGRASGAARV
mgnify:CR=1 FL=1